MLTLILLVCGHLKIHKITSAQEVELDTSLNLLARLCFVKVKFKPKIFSALWNPNKSLCWLL